MASPTNNTVSPPIPNRPNPKPRNSESIDPLRRSFGANPFPPNSRDVSRRNSFGGRERVESNDKENEIKPLITTTPKASKHFMSPTISAASKINASPRKRAVLSDKNDLSRSVDSVVKTHHVSFSDVTTIISTEGTKRFEESYDMTVTDIDEVDVLENKGVVYSDPRFRISPKPCVAYTSPEVVGCESGSSLPPYDPKKNYLSPRPQFLHYKPNPRVEQRFEECKQLEELFVSGSSSSLDTEFSTEEESEDVEQLEAESVEAMVCESIEDVYHKGGAESVEVEETEYVDQLEEETDEEEMVCERNEETSQVPKQSGFRKLRFFGLFLALALGCMLVSATFSPPTELLKGLPSYEFHIPREVTEFARANNLDKLSEKLWTMTESSFAYVDKLILRIGGKEEKYGPLQFHNLTYTLEGYTVFQPTSVEISVAELDHQEPEELLEEKSQGENNVVEDGYVSEFEEESGEEQSSEVVCETTDGEEETNNEIDEETEIKPGTDIELNEGEGNSEASVEKNSEEQSEPELNPGVNDDAGRRESQEMVQDVSTEKLEDFESGANIERHNVESDASINVELQKENEVANTESEAIYIHQQDVESDAAINVYQPKENEVADVESGSETSGDLHPSKTGNDLYKVMIALSSTLLVLLAAVVFLLARKANPVATSAPGPVPDTTTELNLSHEPKEGLLMKEKLSPLSFEVEEVDDTTSTSFYKKSSFQSYNKDTKSGGGKKRRESMASSASEYSVGSFSYGSFTTYEKIPIKSGDREEEMITPVRRSSRLRNNQL